VAQRITAEEAAALIQDNMTLGVGGFGAYAAPDELLSALAERYERLGSPRALTAVCGISPGSNRPDGRGLARLRAPGLLDTVMAGHFANPPEIAELIGTNQVAAYALPLGVMLHLWRAIAGHKPAVLTHVGLGTFADPRVEGCKANQKTRAQGRDIVELVSLDGRDYLAYKTFPIDACFIRATWADEDGSLSMEDEGVGDYAAELAAATHNSGGIVIAQVRGIVSRGSLPPKGVRVHHPMVDYVVVNTDPALHMQSYAAQLRPELSGQLRRPTDSIPPMPLDNRKLIARRGALELRPDCLINLGIGIPSGVGVVANEEGIAQRITLSLESGPQGGVPVEGAGFGSAVNAEAIYTVADTLELYDGGMLDLSFLGAAEVDCRGNVNVSKFGSRCTGPGGFVNISQNTKRVFFTGTFTAGGLKEEVRDGRLVILQEGRSKKFRRQVEQITFSGDYAVKSGQDVTFLTERAVLKLTPDGLMLTEIAPGVELEQDILAQMEFRPLISPELREMDHRIFQAGPMGLTL